MGQGRFAGLGERFGFGTAHGPLPSVLKRLAAFLRARRGISRGGIDGEAMRAKRKRLFCFFLVKRLLEVWRDAPALALGRAVAQLRGECRALVACFLAAGQLVLFPSRQVPRPGCWCSRPKASWGCRRGGRREALGEPRRGALCPVRR